MTLTTVVGSSGSGKTTFLNDLYKRHKCVYIRQYHQIRPYIAVTRIPQFDPTRLPFWHIYVAEGTAHKIPVGGTMAGEFTAGLSGGQRKLLLFELIFQRTMATVMIPNAGAGSSGSATASATNSNSNTQSNTIEKPLPSTNDNTITTQDQQQQQQQQHQQQQQQQSQSQQLLIVLDEPFAGVTDDFVPWIMDRLNTLRQYHNVVLVTNDHVHALTEMADNTITVSAIDRTVVVLNDNTDRPIDREKAILALSGVGDAYVYPSTTNADLEFFCQVEIVYSGALWGALAFTVAFFVLFLATFWNSTTFNLVYVLIAGDTVAFFCVNPYLLSLVDWRNTVVEESEALVHSSRSMNKLLKSLLTTNLVWLIAVVEYAMVNAVANGAESWEFLLAMICDTGSSTYLYICFGLYTDLPHQMTETLAILPFLFLMFFSTTFSPGAGVPVVKELRYLFPRFYFWCIVPGVQDEMEGCPADRGLNMLYLVLTSLLTVLLFLVYKGILKLKQSSKKKQVKKIKQAVRNDEEFKELQRELFEPTSERRKRAKPKKKIKTVKFAVGREANTWSVKGDEILDEIEC